MLDARYKVAIELYPYARVADQDAPAPVRHPVVIVGGGPVGMAMALDLGRQGIAALVLDDHAGVGMGSRAICFAKRTLEICDRLGCADPMVDKGVVWNVGRVYRGTEEVYNFNLLPEDGHKRPAFINLQQPYFEQYVVEEIRRQQAAGAPIEIRGENRVSAMVTHADHVVLDIDTPEGPYRIEADWLIAADGASSPIRSMMDLGFEGRVFEDNFLIADIRMTADFPTERRFWFDPPFNPGETALLHKQPDDVWRLDFQLGWDIDRKAELADDAVRARVKGMIGDKNDFELVWTSIYTFRCCTMENYRHGPVFFVGDSAHQVSPFGARGCNGGIQDIDNLGWKLARVLHGHAPEALLETYHVERKHGARENILNSSRSADFLTPRNPAHELFRDAVLDLVEQYDFAKPLVNSGRLSMPCVYDGSPLNGADALLGAPARSRPGASCPDAPVEGGFLLDMLGDGFQVLALNATAPALPDMPGAPIDLITLEVGADSALAERYLGTATTGVYLLRPDQHVVARWTTAETHDIATALQTALGQN